MANYKCKNLGECGRANSGEVFEIAAGEDMKCPGCGTGSMLELVNIPATGGETNIRLKQLIVGATAAALLLAGGAYYFWSSQRQAAEKIAQEARLKAEADQQAATVKAAELKEEHRKQTEQADAAAQQAKTRQQEQMIAQAVELMAKGQLVDAEKMLGAASDIDSSNPLVPYNLAVLRLHQSRNDDAILALEDSFKLGFSHFDAMEQDHDLDGLRKHPKFKALVAQYRGKVQ